MKRWNPAVELSTREHWLMRRLARTRKLFGFLRERRHELFDAAFQSELEGMYRGEAKGGREPVAPALMAMATLLQAYVGVSDAEAVELTVMDLRWQMVLGLHGAKSPAFAQGTLQGFRERMIRTGMDVRLLERTVELAAKTGAFDPKKLPKTLRIAIDSAPLEGAGRVEDTVNLLAHAARKVVECAATLLEWHTDEVSEAAGIPLLNASSAKRALDVEWSDRAQKAEAVRRVVQQIESLQAWTTERLPDAIHEPPLRDHLATLQQILDQDLEPDPEGGSRIRTGVAPDRRVSIEDGAMRHGRKSKSKRFDGYKRHVAADLDSDLIRACAVTPANRPESTAAELLRDDLARQGVAIGELHIDRGYIQSPVVGEVLSEGGQVVCKPWVPRRRDPDVFTKAAFHIDARTLTITCPAGETEPFEPGEVVQFDPAVCTVCPLRPNCTATESGAGRTVSMAPDELLQVRLRREMGTKEGREKLRERVAVEHCLAHVVRRQGRKARYLGVRKNLFDLRRAATVQNLETLDRRLAAAPPAIAA